MGGVIHPLLAFALGLLLGAGLMLLAIVWVLGSLARRLSDEQLVALFRDIGWIDGGLDELGEGARPLLDWLQPIAEALHAVAHPAADDAGEEPKEPPVADPIAAFRAFEAWYEADRGQPFLQVFERYMPPTPVVEF